MNGRGGDPRGFLEHFMEAALVVVPLLAGIAFVIYFASSDGDTAPAATAPVVQAAVTPASSPVEARTAKPTKKALASASEANVRQAKPDPPKPTKESEAPTSTPDATSSPIVWVKQGRSVDIYDAPRGNVIATQSDATEFGSPSVFSVQHQRKRWFGISTPVAPNGTDGWIRIDSRDLSGGYIDYSIDVDLSSLSASLWQGDTEVRSWPISIGAPASPTPTGKFAVTDTFRGGLNPVYGCCALAISATQPNLPSTWLGGNRIAIHGSASPMGTAISNGCIHSPDADLEALIETVPLGTPVTIHE